VGGITSAHVLLEEPQSYAFTGQSVGKIDCHPVIQMHKYPCTPFNRRSNVYDREQAFTIIRSFKEIIFLFLTLNIPSLARQRCLSSWGPWRTPWLFFVISQLFDAEDYSNYVFWVSETIIQ